MDRIIWKEIVFATELKSPYKGDNNRKDLALAIG